MTKNDFKVTSIFKIIIRICKKNVELFAKTFKFLLKRCLFIFCIFHLNEEELNQQVCLGCIEREILPRIKQKIKEEEQKCNPTS